MRYISTRGGPAVSASQAILRGIADDGGLFVPERIPRLSEETLRQWCGLDYIGLAQRILSLFLEDFSAEQLRAAAEAAYGSSFSSEVPAPLRRLDGSRSVLELFHGPTCAFKDMALRLLPQLMRCAAENVGQRGETLILVATSGDTGKAALEGFRDAPGIKIMVFYPDGGVSPLQKLQMATQEGGNVAVCAVRGTFDDTQTAVKAIFTDEAMKNALSARNSALSSANSINWGRLLPQITYYFSAYAECLRGGGLSFGDKVNFAVPTGNFGNILAGYYAREMGLPVGRLICASNRNHILADFIATGRYDLKRAFYLTLSPSMDILVSSNLERLLFLLSDGDTVALTGLMNSLKNEGHYSVSPALLERLRAVFSGGFCDDARTLDTIRAVYARYGYLIDPHTAVAMAVADDDAAQTAGAVPTVVPATASPYKFAGAVYEALTGRREADEFKAVEALHALTGAPVPAPLAELRGKAVRFDCVLDRSQMPGAVAAFAGL